MSYFAQQATLYAQFRPDYPRELFAFIAEHAPARDVAWDCATGNGQAALGLAEHFARVIATDLSAEQIARAAPHPRVEYRVAPAEAAGVANSSVSAVTVTQALHWIHLPRFYAEVKRALVPGGIFVATVYKDPSLAEPELNKILRHYNRETVGSFWPAQVVLVGENYNTIDFPFPEISPPPLTLQREWNLAELAGYLRSYSATVRFVNANGYDPVNAFEAEMQAAGWRDAAVRRRITWKFIVKAGCKPRTIASKDEFPRRMIE